MMRLVKRLGGIQDSGTAASSSFITEFPASNAGPSKKGQIVSNMGGDVQVVECTGPIPVEFEIHPKYAVNQILPAVCTEARSRRRNTAQTMPAMPVVKRVKASETSKSLSPPGTPRSTSKASNTSTTLECEKHAMLPIVDLPGAREKQCAPCSVCKACFKGRTPKVWRYCVPCSDIPNGKLVCVCSRKRETAETDDSCDLYHTRHPLDFISTHSEFLKVHKQHNE